MANTYAWTINKLDVRPTQNSLSNVVYNVHYSYTATSDQTDSNNNAYKSTVIGVAKIDEPNSEDFTAFDELTQSDVEAWLIDNLDVNQLKSNLDNLITEKITPTSVTKDVPW
jgi:hypothetical protein|tara:strand:- start:466 stop:801 length:336 start_codon:yes stop_codon:yes gene_type:complete